LEAWEVVDRPTLEAANIDPFLAILPVKKNILKSRSPSHVEFEAVVVRIIPVKEHNVDIFNSLDLSI